MVTPNGFHAQRVSVMHNRAFYNLLIFNVMHDAKKQNTTAELRQELISHQERAQYLETVGEVFMYYICTLGSDIILTKEHLDRVHWAYFKEVQEVKKD